MTKTAKNNKRTPGKGDQVMKIRGKNLYRTGKVVDVYECRGVPSATIAHKNILGQIEYFTSSLKQLEIL